MIIAFINLLCLFNANANEHESIYSADHGWNLGVGFGYGKIENPVHQVDDIPLILIPRIEYFTEEFSLVNTQMSWSPFLTENGQFSVVSRLNDDGLNFISSTSVASLTAPFIQTPAMGTVPPPNGSETDQKPVIRRGNIDDIGKRRLSYMLGIEWLYDWHFWRIRSSWYQEITQLYHGDEAFINIERSWQNQDHLFILGFEVQRQSADLIDYYYGIHGKEIGAGFSQYTGQAVINLSVQAKYQYFINEQWQIISDMKYKSLDDELSNSSVITKENTMSFYLGLAWDF